VRDTNTTYDNRNVVLFRNESNNGLIANTYYWIDSSGNLVDSDMIIYDADYRFYAFDGTCDSTVGYGVYVHDLTTHEFGHMLGLSHSSDPSATMAYGYAACSTTQRTLESDDISGIQALYGKASSGGNNNTAPSASISSPGNGANYSSGATIGFSGSASDAQDGNLTSHLTWSSSIDGQIGTGGSFSRSLSSGTHTITAAVADSGGLTNSSSVTITVAAAATNTAPSVSISSPGNAASFPQGSSISFSASATDTLDGNISSGLAWTSNIDGSIGSGGSLSRTLSAGTHTITAWVTDSSGMTGSRSVTITVVAASSSTTGASLSARGYKTKGLQKADLSWSGLSAGQTDIYRNSVRVTTTSNSGKYTDNIGNRGGGSYSYTVCDAGTSTCSNSVTVSF